MAPIAKASLALLALSGAAVSAVSARKGSGKHMKMVKRNGLFEDLGRRDELAPYGYDRCGVARKSPYIRKAGASPSASRNWKACPTATPTGDAVAAAAATPAGLDAAPTTTQQIHDGSDDGNEGDDYTEGDDEDDDVYVINAQGVLVPASSASAVESSSEDGVDAPTDTWDRAQFAGPTASSDDSGPTTTAYTTNYVDITSYTTTYPSSSAPASTPQKKIVAAAANNQNNGDTGDNDWSKPAVSSSSSSSSQWVAPASSASSSKWVAPASSSSSSSQWVAPASSSAAASSKTSSSVAPAATPDNVARSYGVMGLAWDWQNPKGVLHNWCNGSKQKIYTWSAYPPSDALCSNMEWYPQYWGPAKQGEFEANVASGIIRPGMTILGYNEPDQAGQSNLGVWDGINSYKSQITKYASMGYRITTPGCTSDEKGFNWLSGFIEGCAGSCGFSAIQTHYYGTDADAFIAYIQRIHNAWPQFPIIISEYAAETFGNGPDLTQEQSNAYLYKTQEWLKKQSFVDSYFFFGPLTTKAANGVNHNNLLIEDSGAVKALGWQYLSSA